MIEEIQCPLRVSAQFLRRLREIGLEIWLCVFLPREHECHEESQDDLVIPRGTCALVVKENKHLVLYSHCVFLRNFCVVCGK